MGGERPKLSKEPGCTKNHLHRFRICEAGLRHPLAVGTEANWELNLAVGKADQQPLSRRTSPALPADAPEAKTPGHPKQVLNTELWAIPVSLL